MADASDHVCRYAQREVWDGWEVRDGCRERVGRRVPRCLTCGRERPARRPRPPGLVESAMLEPGVAPASDAEVRAVGAVLLRRLEGTGETHLSWRGIVGGAKRRGVPASKTESVLESMYRAGWLGLRYQLSGTRRVLRSVWVLAPDALQEFVHPGLRAQCQEAFANARSAVRGVTHPVAREIEQALLRDGAERLSPPLLRALAAVARHVEDGDQLATRVFSARRLGDSKALARVRASLERIVGPLDALGVRDGAAVTLLGGTGRLGFDSTELDLAALSPFVGLGSDTLDRLVDAGFPAEGLVVVENLAPFEASCRGLVSEFRGAMVLWSAGYPGRGVRRMVEAAAGRNAPIRVWADLDLDGVRIARLVASWAPDVCRPALMSPEDVSRAAVSLPLSERAADAIRVDLERFPDALLADALRAMLASGRWVEQETFL